MSIPAMQPEEAFREAVAETEHRRFPNAVRFYAQAAQDFEARGDVHAAWDAGLLAWQLMNEVPSISNELNFSFVNELFSRFMRCAGLLESEAATAGDPTRAEMFRFTAVRAHEMQQKVRYFLSAREDLGGSNFDGPGLGR
ncbi:MAG: hypothetical protein ACOYN3_01720 [Acidimicrobiia bacterium]